jgi:ATP/ADP translocase
MRLKPSKITALYDASLDYFHPSHVGLLTLAAGRFMIMALLGLLRRLSRRCFFVWLLLCSVPFFLLLPWFLWPFETPIADEKTSCETQSNQRHL